MQGNISSNPSNLRKKQVARWLALAGVVGPILFFLWYVVIGWRLFVTGGSSKLEDSPQGHKREPEQLRR